MQWQFARSMVAEVAYVQNDGKDLLQFEEMNQPFYVAGQTTALNKDLFRPYRGFSSVLRSTNWGHSDYKGLETSVQRRFANGLAFGVSYTLATSHDLSSGFHSGATSTTYLLKPQHRAGTPQARHVHALLLSGQRALSELFPGFEQDLAQAGAVPLRAGLDVRVERPGYDPFPQRDLGWISYAVSRPTIERAVRRRVEGLTNTTLHQRCRVQEILASANGEMITGVRYENGSGATETIAADLVVDASGRGVPTLDLLKSIGRPEPEETTIGIDLRYATCVFDVPDDAPADWKGVMTFGQAPQSSRGGLMLPLEGNRWMATLGGLHEDAPSGDAEEFLTFAGSLRTSTIYNALRRARRLDGLARYHFTGSVRRHFEKSHAFPRGLLPIADAICRFNPVYGQGMSVAAQEACLLRRILETSAERGRSDRRAGAHFFRGRAGADRDTVVGGHVRLRVSHDHRGSVRRILRPGSNSVPPCSSSPRKIQPSIS